MTTITKRTSERAGNSLHTLKRLTGVVMGSALLATPLTTSAAVEFITNPDWGIEISDFGYSDILLDLRPGFSSPTFGFREYLSGEWAGAVAYNVGGTPVAPTWYEPNFIFPDWTTNSNFNVVNPIAATGTVNADGFQIYESTISNNQLRIDMTFQMLDSGTGVEQGLVPASQGGSGDSLASFPYVLSQSHTITNISEQAITDLQAFQFLHSLEAQTAIYDDRFYGGPFGDYRYDITQQGLSQFPTFDSEGNIDAEAWHFDTVTLHSPTEPSAWEVGYYGILDGISGDDHDVGKPSIGVHFSVEGNSLNGEDSFAPDTLWVSGAERYELGDLGFGESVSYDVLLSVHTESTIIPIPPAVWLFGSGLLALVGAARRKTAATRAI